MKRRSRASQSCERAEITIAERGEKIGADGGNGRGSVGESGLEAFEEGRCHGDEVVAVGDEIAGVGAGGDEGLIDVGAVGVGFLDADAAVGGEEESGIVEWDERDGRRLQIGGLELGKDEGRHVGARIVERGRGKGCASDDGVDNERKEGFIRAIGDFRAEAFVFLGGLRSGPLRSQDVGGSDVVIGIGVDDAKGASRWADIAIAVVAQGRNLQLPGSDGRVGCCKPIDRVAKTDLTKDIVGHSRKTTEAVGSFESGRRVGVFSVGINRKQNDSIETKVESHDGIRRERRQHRNSSGGDASVGNERMIDVNGSCGRIKNGSFGESLLRGNRHGTWRLK